MGDRGSTWGKLASTWETVLGSVLDGLGAVLGLSWVVLGWLTESAFGVLELRRFPTGTIYYVIVTPGPGSAVRVTSRVWLTESAFGVLESH